VPFHIKTPKTLENKGFRRYYLARQKGFEPPAFPLGELLNNCHTCSPMFKKASNHQAFFTFRIASCSPKFTVVVRCLPAQISSFLDFAKKGKKNNFHLTPFLAVLSAKINLNRTENRNMFSSKSLKSICWGR